MNQGNAQDKMARCRIRGNGDSGWVDVVVCVVEMGMVWEEEEEKKCRVGEICFVFEIPRFDEPRSRLD